MKNAIKHIIAAIAALLSLASPIFAGDLIGETPGYRIYRIQVGNSQTTAIVYEKKPETVALNVRNTTVASQKSAKQAATVARQDAHGQFTIPGSIN